MEALLNQLQPIYDAIANSFTQFGVRDAIDILLVCFVIYKLLALTKGTRAIQVLKGLGLLIVAAQASKLLGLTVVGWLLDYAVSAGAIALVVLFQPELRRALEQIGHGRFLGKNMLRHENDYSHVVEELQCALLEMSKRRVGALIVVECRTGLEDLVGTGTLIHGRVSSALIENIFEPNTPLHDGAMIVRNDMIVAAGCFLPLSENTGIARELGTRHRAAIGVSEVSDSVTFVVSEETGVISMAKEGKIIRYLDAKALKDMLGALFIPSEKEQRRRVRGRKERANA